MTIDEMAHEAGVSYVTMWKAVHAKDGCIYPGKSTGGRQPPPSTARAAAADSAAFSWGRVMRRIEEDLFSGCIPLPRGGLLQAKALCGRYGVGFRTMRKALAALCDRGMIERLGRNYRHAARSLPSGSSVCIGVLVLTWYSGPIIPYGNYTQEFLPALESECGRRNIRVEFLRYQLGEDCVTFRNAEESARIHIDRRNDISGYVLPVWDSGCVNESLLSALRATRKPVAVIDQTGGEVDAADLVTRGGKALLIDALPYQTAGFEVGRALAARGHRRCAFFSLAKTDPQARKCLRGLCDAGPASGAFSATAFALEGTFGPNSLCEISEKKYGFESAIRKYYDGLKEKLPAFYQTHLDPYFGHLLHTFLSVLGTVRIVLGTVLT